ncbi:MAG: hypothetical protein AB1393_13140 [Candidatus Edwardsbacteria bacterium]
MIAGAKRLILLGVGLTILTILVVVFLNLKEIETSSIENATAKYLRTPVRKAKAKVEILKKAILPGKTTKKEKK